MEPRTFTAVTDEVMVRLIKAAQERIVLIAPGISKDVADNLGLRLLEDRLSVTVVLDADPEVFRLGLGTLDGLKAIQAHAEKQHLALQSHPGIRIGVLVSDATTLIFAPTPKLIEAGSTTPNKPNAILLGGDAAVKVARAAGAPGSTPQDDLAGGAAQPIEVGTCGLTPTEVKKTEEDLRRNPPQSFDLARRARVFSSKVQYVEFEVTNYRVRQKEVSIPSDLMVISDDTDLRDRWRNSLRILDEAFARVEMPLDPAKPDILSTMTPDFIQRRRRDLEKKYLFAVRGHGVMVLKANRGRFEKDADDFRLLVERFVEGLRTKWVSHRTPMATKICDTLLPRIRQKTPDRYKKFNPSPSDDDLRGLVLADVQKAFDVDKVLEQPSVRLVFKEVAPESLHSEPFKRELSAAFGRDGMSQKDIDSLFNEADAVLETQAAPTT